MRFTYYFKNIFRTGKNEIGSLNGLRALAIILVLLHHATPILSHITNSSEVVLSFFHNFVSGVDLFLLLSGYLISKELQKSWLNEGKIDFKIFYIRRTLRIFPAYYFFLLLSLIAYKIMLNSASVRSGPEYERILATYQRWPLDFLYMTDYFQGLHPHTLSLSVEEKYYLILPFFFHFAYFHVSIRNRMLILSVLYLIPFIIRLVTFSQTDMSIGEYRIFNIYYPLHSRFDALIVGIIIMELHTNWNILEKFDRYKFLKPSFYLLGLLILFLSHSTHSKTDSISFQV